MASFDDAARLQWEEAEWKRWERECSAIPAVPFLRLPADLPPVDDRVKAQIREAINCIELACVCDDGRARKSMLLSDVAWAAKNARAILRNITK